MRATMSRAQMPELIRRREGREVWFTVFIGGALAGTLRQLQKM